MKKKLFLLIIFVTPCLSWAAKRGSKKAIIRKPANQPVSCAQAPATAKTNASAYGLGIKNQTEKMQFSIAEIMRKQGACASTDQ